MSVWYVSGTGDDANGGGVSAPFRTVGKAHEMAAAGDTIRMRTGRYVETLQVAKANLKFVRDTPGDRPVMDGASPLGALANGIWGYTSGCIVDGLEVTGYTGRGLFFQAGSRASYGSNEVRNCEVHDIYNYAASALYTYGITMTWGKNNVVEDNLIHHIGYGGESRGIFLLESDGPICRRNVIWSTTKEGIRDYRSRDAQVYSNHVFGCWTGISMNANIGGDFYDNFVHDCTQGFNPKHCNYTGSQTFWSDTSEKWTRLHHNTAEDMFDCSIAIGVNTVDSTVPADISRVDIRNNVWKGRGWVRIFDFPNIVEVPGTIVCDNNQYLDSPLHVYRRSYDPYTVYYDTLADMQANTTFEDNANVPYNSPILGLQMGAVSYPESPVELVDIPVTVVDAKNPPRSGTTWTASIDGYVWTYRLTQTATDEWLVFDLGTPQLWNTVVESPYFSPDTRAIKAYLIEAADSPTGPWTLVAEGAINDPQGASRQIKCPDTTSRYVRFTARTAFGGAYFVFCDFHVRRFQAAGEPPAPVALPRTAVEIEV